MKTPAEPVRVRLKIKGRVQGVYFRASTVEQAKRLGLTGWVRNCPDGSVEAVAEGWQSKVDDFVAWCHHGPPGAVVDQVRLHYETFTGEFEHFGIRR